MRWDHGDLKRWFAWEWWCIDPWPLHVQINTARILYSSIRVSCWTVDMCYVCARSSLKDTQVREYETTESRCTFWIWERAPEMGWFVRVMHACFLWLGRLAGKQDVTVTRVGHYIGHARQDNTQRNACWQWIYYRIFSINTCVTKLMNVKVMPWKTYRWGNCWSVIRVATHHHMFVDDLHWEIVTCTLKDLEIPTHTSSLQCLIQTILVLFFLQFCVSCNPGIEIERRSCMNAMKALKNMLAHCCRSQSELR